MNASYTVTPARALILLVFYTALFVTALRDADSRRRGQGAWE